MIQNGTVPRPFSNNGRPSVLDDSSIRHRRHAEFDVERTRSRPLWMRLRDRKGPSQPALPPSARKSLRTRAWATSLGRRRRDRSNSSWTLVAPPITIPSGGPVTTHYRTRQITAVRRYAPCTGPVPAGRSCGDALHHRAADQDVTMPPHANGLTDQSHEGIPRADRIARRTGVTLGTGSIDLACRYARKPDPRTLLAPDGSIAVPYRRRRA